MTVNELKKFATDVRIETVKCLEARTFGHIGGCLSIADVLTVLYNGELKNIDRLIRRNWTEICWLYLRDMQVRQYLQRLH